MLIKSDTVCFRVPSVRMTILMILSMIMLKLIIAIMLITKSINASRMWILL